MIEIEIVQFLRKPFIPVRNGNIRLDRRLNALFKIYLIYLLFTICIYLILSFIDKTFIVHFYKYSILQQQQSINQKLNELYGHYTFLIVVIIGPFLEEIIFRLPLNLKRFSIALSVCFVTYRFCGGSFTHFNTNNPYGYLLIILSAILFIVTIKWIPNKWIDFIKERYFAHFFYLSALIFAFVHITNFAPYNYNVLLLYPLFTLPQLIMGITIGYTRLNYGFVAGWFLHGLINLPFALFG